MDIQIIHVVLGKANPNRTNGVNKVVNSLATYQTQLGYDVSVWGITKNVTINYPSRNYKTKLFKDVAKFKLDNNIVKTVKKQQSNTVFHIHGGFIPQFYLVAKLLNKYEFNYVYTSHGAYNTVALQRSLLKKKIYIQLFEKYIVKHAKLLHFIGKSEIEGAEKVFGKLPKALIPNGQNTEELTFSYSSLNEKTCPIFGFVGRIDIRTKGLDLLLKGFAKYLDNRSGVGELWLVGGGEEQADLEQLARNLDISSNVKFLGSKYGNDKLNTIANMDYLCLTSRNEGLPGVVLEAAGLGVPSIVSPQTNMTDYVTSNRSGLSLVKNTPEVIAMAFQTARIWHHNGELKKLKINARKMIENQFNWKNISAQLIETYAA